MATAKIAVKSYMVVKMTSREKVLISIRTKEYSQMSMGAKKLIETSLRVKEE